MTHKIQWKLRSVPLDELENINWCKFILCYVDGFGGLVVSMLGVWYQSLRVQTRPKSLDFSGIWKILHVPSFRGEVKESVPCPSFATCKRTCYLRELRCASKIPCIVPPFASRGLSRLCGAWHLQWWMRGTDWGQGYDRPTGCSAEKAHTHDLYYICVM